MEPPYGRFFKPVGERKPFEVVIPGAKSGSIPDEYIKLFRIPTWYAVLLDQVDHEANLALSAGVVSRSGYQKFAERLIYQRAKGYQSIISELKKMGLFNISITRDSLHRLDDLDLPSVAKDQLRATVEGGASVRFTLFSADSNKASFQPFGPYISPGAVHGYFSHNATHRNAINGREVVINLLYFGVEAKSQASVSEPPFYPVNEEQLFLEKLRSYITNVIAHETFHALTSGRNYWVAKMGITLQMFEQFYGEGKRLNSAQASNHLFHFVNEGVFEGPFYQEPYFDQMFQVVAAIYGSEFGNRKDVVDEFRRIIPETLPHPRRRLARARIISEISEFASKLQKQIEGQISNGETTSESVIRAREFFIFARHVSVAFEEILAHKTHDGQVDARAYRLDPRIIEIVKREMIPLATGLIDIPETHQQYFADIENQKK